MAKSKDPRRLAFNLVVICIYAVSALASVKAHSCGGISTGRFNAYSNTPILQTSRIDRDTLPIASLVDRDNSIETTRTTTTTISTVTEILTTSITTTTQTTTTITTQTTETITSCIFDISTGITSSPTSFSVYMTGTHTTAQTPGVQIPPPQNFGATIHIDDDGFLTTDFGTGVLGDPYDIQYPPIQFRLSSDGLLENNGISFAVVPFTGNNGQQNPGLGIQLTNSMDPANIVAGSPLFYMTYSISTVTSATIQTLTETITEAIPIPTTETITETTTVATYTTNVPVLRFFNESSSACETQIFCVPQGEDNAFKLNPDAPAARLLIYSSAQAQGLNIGDCVFVTFLVRSI